MICLEIANCANPRSSIGTSDVFYQGIPNSDQFSASAEKSYNPTSSLHFEFSFPCPLLSHFTMSFQNRGLVKTAVGKAAIKPVPIPRLRDEYILVKTVAVALNPTDWQTVDEKFKPGTTYSLLGCDAAGIVVEVGSKVTKNFKKGDRITGFSHGGIYPFPNSQKPQF